MIIFSSYIAKDTETQLKSGNHGKQKHLQLFHMQLQSFSPGALIS